MAASRSTASQALIIALIVFVTLTFILSVTTYLGYKGRADEFKRAEEVTKSLTDTQGKLTSAENEKKELLERIGIAMTDPEKLGESIETWFGERFGDFKEDPKTYERLAEWLQKAIREKDGQLKTLLAEKENQIAALKRDIAVRDESVEEFKKQADQAKKDAGEAKSGFDEFRRKNEQEKDDLNDKYQKALAQATELEAIEQAVARAEDMVSSRRIDRFKTQGAEERVGTMLEELRERERAINQANALLAKLRVADPSLQKTIAEALPPDDRIDGFDGRIVSVDQSDRSVLMLCRSTRGMRPGLMFYVYGPDDPTPQISSKKGVVEVMTIESPTLARARIREDSLGNPILGGDGVATSLWETGTQFTSVIVGFVQIDRDAGADVDRLTALIEGVGGRVEDAVTPLTTMLIDAGPPQTVMNDKQRKVWQEKDQIRRKKQLDEARRLGVRVINLNQFMPMLGLQRDSLDANRPPNTAASR